MNSNVKDRQESDRVAPKGIFSALISRTEIGPIGLMLLLFGMLGYFSIPAVEQLGTHLRAKVSMPWVLEITLE